MLAGYAVGVRGAGGPLFKIQMQQGGERNSAYSMSRQMLLQQRSPHARVLCSCVTLIEVCCKTTDLV